MGKSDEPTRIQVNRGTGGAKRKTANKTTKTMSKREAEKISDAADALVMDDVKPAKKPTKSATKTPVKTASKSAKAGAKSLVVDGMVRQKSTAKAKPINTKGDLDAKADSLKLDEKKLIDDEEVEQKEAKAADNKAKKQFSKSKAAMIAIATAILVGAIGMVLLFFLNRQSETMCVLQFESNGGTKIEDQEVVCGTKANRPDDPEKEGFEFQDWLLEGMPFVFEEDTVDRDMVVIAKWLVNANAEIVKITFDSAGGSEVTEREALKGATTTPPLDPTRDGYTFDGWYLDGEKFDFETPIEEDITLVAGWKSSDGTLTIPQGGNSGGTSNKPSLDLLSVTPGISMKVGTPDSYPIGVIPVSAEVDLSVSSSDKSVVDCTMSGRSMSCSAAKAGTAEVTIRDAISGKTVKTTITVTGNNSGYTPPSGGGTSGGTTTPTTPTTPTCGTGEVLVDGKCEPEPTKPTEPTEKEECETGGGTWNGTVCQTKEEE